MNYPWYFQYKELASPSQSYDRPPMRPRADRPHPVRDSTTPAPAPPVARSRRRLPPSPSPSDRSSSASSSSSSPSPSPSRSRSPSPVPSPSPPHVASLLRMSLTPRPNHVSRGPPSASVVPSGPRPHLRPNAVASSSRTPIKVESSPYSSSASPASDVHLWGNSGPDQDIESEHEMENDTGHVPSLASRVKSEPSPPLKPTTSLDPVGSVCLKRPQPSESPTPAQDGPSKRHKVRYEAPSSTPSGSETDTTSDESLPHTVAEVRSDYDEETDETRSSLNESEGESEDIGHGQGEITAGCSGCRDVPGSTPLKRHSCSLSRTYISRLKAAVERV